MEQSYYLPGTEESFLKLERPIVFFDLETTGTSVMHDRIVEICGIKLMADGSQQELHHLINPTIPISAGAMAVHGITNEMVASKPTFENLLAEISDFFEGCDLSGYNIRRFDVPLLMQEFGRFKKYPIQLSEVKIVDAMGIYHSKERRDLSAAVRFYCNREHENAHSAKADVLATIDILKNQLLKYNDLQPNTSFLHDFTSPNGVDFSGKFARDDEGRIVFNFGKHKGKEACTEPDYLKWMISEGEFAVDTRMVANRIYKNCIWEKDIKAWLHKNKLLHSTEVASALYAAVKFSNDIFPFAVQQQGAKLKVTYLAETESSYVLEHKDAVNLLVQMLDGHLQHKDNEHA